MQQAKRLTASDIEAMIDHNERAINRLRDGDEATALLTAARAQVETRGIEEEDDEWDTERGRLWEEGAREDRRSREMLVGCLGIVFGILASLTAYAIGEIIKKP